ncbi:2-amino-4-hydroxy-6-hydroxymethyldihydropteridine diphosphokinase [Sporomusaceae bacterium BoRhaA]|uniref:2-amino-4-hydroxy-6- hydroxymethyldihydropteridine diphosphokinase n=1 Tax=Pelorhabdus rhamnosifermentans TaxID=2772457 RepID=UPI001C0638F6|nr:2-amino-4-hydroxy-6-hydroxymethyldihydropteridine diphosphokinase [Pelorhabdus rhamnosifermentans]MBU2702026.1 2-amino-4-hydroxy-6-hydroxymethyldihydropteridine diphosphokinase [Pelorhabdus rhamnosifermentans]
MIYLGLGSNMGDRAFYIRQALILLESKQVHIEKISSFYETAPVGVTDQRDFLNIVAAVSTSYGPLNLLEICLGIEQALGRVRTRKWGPRTVDIDILLYHEEAIQQERLIIPHPYLHERRFVLAPLAEIAGDTPIVQGYSATQLLNKLVDDSIVRRLSVVAKIMFMTVPIGAGHMRAAQAVEQAVNELAKKENSCITTVQYNLFDFLPQKLTNKVLSIYLAMLSWCPSVYGGLYEWGNESALALLGRNLFNRFIAWRMRRAVLDFRPDMIVCSHASAAGVASQLIRKKVYQVPIVAVVTDFVVHRFWIYSEVTHYFVALEKLKQYLVDHAIQTEQISVTGIPIDLSFENPMDRNILQQKIKLNPAVFTVLIMGGGQGAFPLVKLVQLIDSLDFPVQIIVVAGNNTAAFEQLNQLKLKVQHQLTVYGFVNIVHELMAVADLLITKPGGLTTAEALAAQLPLLIYHPIPGQEQANTQHLLDEGAAMLAENLTELKQCLVRFEKHFSRPKKVQQQKGGQNHAARQIATKILQLLNKFSK